MGIKSGIDKCSSILAVGTMHKNMNTDNLREITDRLHFLTYSPVENWPLFDFF